ncbi:MAG TPA: hypothetical protein VHL78_05625, partial [Actinomycetota bacterium]|nr:hypothetical protein [Actinomycetota bacterium]
EAEEAPAPAPAKATTAKKPAAKKPTPRKAAAKAATAGAAKTTTRKSAARGGAEVVVIPERGTYHQSTCRFVRGRRDTEKLNRTTAKRRGYDACGVCKPDAA